MECKLFLTQKTNVVIILNFDIFHFNANREIAEDK